MIIFVMLLLVYIMGLRQGLQVVHDVEMDAAVRVWASFLGLLDVDPPHMNSTTTSENDDDDDDGLNDNDDTSDDDDGKNNVDDDSSSEDMFEMRLAFQRARARIVKAAVKQSPKVEVIFEAPSQLKLPKPIINVGFPKAGTSTIFSFLHCNGLAGQHWYCCDKQEHPGVTANHRLMSRCMLENMANGTAVLEGCGDFDFYSEINGPRFFQDLDGRNMLDDGTLLPVDQSKGQNARIFFPQHHHLDEIHQQYPNATFILNLRPVDAWIASVLKWKSKLEFEILNEFYFQNSTRFLFGPKVKPVNEQNSPFVNTNIRSHLATVFEYHSRYIRDWVAQHPSHALVEVDISHNDTGRILADAFGLRQECWGHFNQNKGDDSQAKKQQARRRRHHHDDIKHNGKFERRAPNGIKPVEKWRSKLKVSLRETLNEGRMRNTKERTTGPFRW
jgi:Sulfotransferase domain